MEWTNLNPVRRLGATVVVMSALCAAGVAVGVTPVLAEDVVPAVVPTGAASYVALDAPVRAADTRTTIPGGAFGFTTLDSGTVPCVGATPAPGCDSDDGLIEIDIDAIDGVPAGATAAVLNVAVVSSSGGGYAVVYPSGETRPTASSVNVDGPGRTIANMVHVKLGTLGKVRVYRTMAANLVIDLLGVYVPVDPAVAEGAVAAGRFVPLATEKRVLDTRLYGGRFNAGDSRTVLLKAINPTTGVPTGSSVVPTTASAVVVSIAGVQAAPGYHWTVYPTSSTTVPNTSTMNLDFSGAITRAAQAIVALDGDTSVKVYSAGGGHLVVDVVGYYTGDADVASTDGLFLAASPSRLLDTRDTNSSAPWNGSTFEFDVDAPVGATVAAAVINLTATRPWDAGFVTAYAARTARPTTSNLNISMWPQTIANHAIVPVSASYGAAVYTNAGAHLIADVEGWFTGTPKTATTGRVSNPNPVAADANWLFIPKLNKSLPVILGPDPEAIADFGHFASWNWKARIAPDRRAMIFGHRTTNPSGIKANAPFHYLPTLDPGDIFYVGTTSGQWYKYKVLHEGIIDPYYSIAEWVANTWNTATLQLIACSQINGDAGGSLYRYITTARLVGLHS